MSEVVGRPDSDFVNCVPLRESLLYALKHNVHYSCYDNSDYEERQLCKILNGLVCGESWIATPTGRVSKNGFETYGLVGSGKSLAELDGTEPKTV